MIFLLYSNSKQLVKMLQCEALVQVVDIEIRILSKPKWACASCGMYSSRRCSVKRHIQKIHLGEANLVSFIDYLVGRKSGYYWPNPAPSYQKKDDKIDYTRIMKEQLFAESIRKGFSSL